MKPIRLRQGEVHGRVSSDGAVAIHLGVPFAQAPVGDLRWREPLPLLPSADVIDAARHGAICPQTALPPGTVLPLGDDEPQDENCLFLNVWSPAEPSPIPRPVVMFLHLGAFQLGSASAPIYDGENWARSGVVFVTPNYRLGKLGFLAHPALSAEQGGYSGNYGLLDQIAALEWIRDNIAAFGGDPNCVTIAGISAGASSVSLLMAAPRANGLFHRVICESGGSFGPVMPHTACGDAWQDLASAERSGERWAEGLRLTTTAQLRAMTIDDIRASSAPDWSDNNGVFDAAQPIVDGMILPEGAASCFTQGKQARVPLLCGSVANEDLLVPCSMSLEAYERDVPAIYGHLADEFRALYPATTDSEAMSATMKANSHRLFTWQNETMARLHSAAGNETYYYRFEMVPPVPADRYPEQAMPRPLGAFHGASMFYTFRQFGLRDWPWSDADFALSDRMIEAWVAFARTGRPTAVGLPEWPCYDEGTPQVMALNAQPALQAIPDQQYLRFWQRFNTERETIAAQAGSAPSELAHVG